MVTQKRTAELGTMKIHSITRGSVCDIGDVHHSSPHSDILAIQKEGAIFASDTFPFTAYSLFQRERIPRVLEPIRVHQATTHHHPTIRVNHVNLLGASTSSVIQVGSLEKIQAEARIKHIRILQNEQNEE